MLFVADDGLGVERPATDQIAERPNIIFLMTDDLGWADLGVYGNDILNTPRLDRMAAEGARFTQVYAGASVCGPSRRVLMS